MLLSRKFSYNLQTVASIFYKLLLVFTTVFRVLNSSYCRLAEIHCLWQRPSSV